MNPQFLLEFIRELIVSHLIPITLKLVVIGAILVLITATLSPFETLGWWAGWFGRTRRQKQAAMTVQETFNVKEPEDIDHYVVYLSGIGDISGETLEAKEKGFVDALAKRLPDGAIVKDVFPYAMNNNSLTGHRMFAALWRWIERRKLNGKELLSNLINIRNLFQVAVSADRRYGPIYNYGTAEVIRDGLLRQGYRAGCGKPITLIGFSGGGQIALGAALYLKPMLRAALQIISVGGVFADDPGFADIDHLYHIYSQKDFVPRLGTIFYAGRWPLLPYSPWNKARAEGKITMIPVGPMKHHGKGSYFDGKSYLENGQSHQEHIAEIVASLINSSTGPLLMAAGIQENTPAAKANIENTRSTFRRESTRRSIGKR